MCDSLTVMLPLCNCNVSYWSFSFKEILVLFSSKEKKKERVTFINFSRGYLRSAREGNSLH